MISVRFSFSTGVDSLEELVMVKNCVKDSDECVAKILIPSANVNRKFLLPPVNLQVINLNQKTKLNLNMQFVKVVQN